MQELLTEFCHTGMGANFKILFSSAALTLAAVRALRVLLVVVWQQQHIDAELNNSEKNKVLKEVRNL